MLSNTQCYKFWALSVGKKELVKFPENSVLLKVPSFDYLFTVQSDIPENGVPAMGDVLLAILQLNYSPV